MEEWIRLFLHKQSIETLMRMQVEINAIVAGRKANELPLNEEEKEYLKAGDRFAAIQRYYRRTKLINADISLADVRDVIDRYLMSNQT